MAASVVFSAPSTSSYACSSSSSYLVPRRLVSPWRSSSRHLHDAPPRCRLVPAAARHNVKCKLTEPLKFANGAPPSFPVVLTDQTLLTSGQLQGADGGGDTKLRIFSGTANPALSQEIACYLGLNLGKIKIKRFADGEIYVQLQESVRGCDVFLVQPTCPPANENLMELLIMIDACRRASAKNITAVIPYFGYARADRKTQGRESIAAKLVANLITEAGANRVLACDLHSGQSMGYFDIPVDHVYGQPVILDYLASKTICSDELVVVSPDVGGVARARAFAKKLSDAPLAIVDKRRHAHNVAEVMNLIGDVKGKVAVMVDDMIDTAGTIAKGAALLHEEGAREVYACSTHAVFSPPAIERLSSGLFQEVIITNTIPVSEQNYFPQLTVLSVANLLGETIWRVHDDCSVVALECPTNPPTRAVGEPPPSRPADSLGLLHRLAFPAAVDRHHLLPLPIAPAERRRHPPEEATRPDVSVLGRSRGALWPSPPAAAAAPNPAILSNPGRHEAAMDSAESSITPMGKPTLECAGINTPSPGDIIFPECDQFMTPEENALRTQLTADQVEGDGEAEPRNGMEFERHEDVYAFYNRYARRVGFGVTTVTSRTKKGAFIFFHYACHRSGQSRKKPDAMSHRDSAKTSCRASIRARVDKETNKWRLTDVEIEHNHELNPRSAIFLRSHRKICSSENADAVGDPPMSKIVSSVARRKGGISELEFREDCGNFVHRECQSQVREGDAQTMVNHFLGMQVSWHSMESGEQLHEDSNVGNHAQGHLDSTKEGSMNGSTAVGTSLAENAGGGLVASANISGDRHKDSQGQPDTMKERSADGSSAAQQAVGGSAAAANIADNREKNQATPDPVVGMAFETEQAAYDCYSEYGKRNGFTVRWDNRTLSRRTGVTLARRFVCSKQGRRGDGQRRRHSLAKYHREETRCGCLAYMKIKLASDGKYRIIELNATHNHPLACQVPVNYSLANLVLYNHPLANQVPNIRPVPIQVANIRPLPNQVPNIRPVPIQVPSIRPLPNQVPNISPIPNQLPNIHPLSNQVPYNHPVAVFVPINAQVQGHPLGNKIAPNPILANPHTAHVVIMQRLPGAQAAAAKKIKRKRKSADDSDGPVAPDATSQDMDTQASSLENVGSLPADAQNYLPMKRVNVMQKFDIDGLFEYFKSKQAQNTSFFYSFQLDVDEKITNVFWMDGRMRTDYMRFGDILCFDTTYKTNDYGRPLALFVGVNHHKQTIIFGAALLYDESAYSFQWVFRTFLEAVGGKMPNTIITDESSAITSAIESEVPGIPHRLCVWHLYQNASKKLAKVFTGSKDFDDDFSRCIYDYDVEADFLEGWNAMLEKYGLVENAWLQQKFKDREKWAPVYGRSAFCADLKSAQHRERMNKELKRYLSPARDIETFLQNFDKFLEEKRNKELEANSKMTKSSPYAPPVSIIQHAARVYTSAVFDMFMTEYVAGLECLVKDRQYDGPLQMLTVEDGQHHDHIVRINFDEEILSCSCCKFENVGILCGHVLTCITKKMRSIPDRYILKRWTRCAGNLSVIYHANTTVEDQRCSLSQRYNSLVHDFVQLSVRAAEDEDIYNCAMKHKAAMCEEMEKVFKEKTSSLSYHLFGEHVW